MGGFARYLDDYKTALSILQNNAGQTIVVNGQVAKDQGSAQTMFSATEAQRASTNGNTGFFDPQGSIVPGADQRDAARLENMQAANGGAKPVYPVEEVLLGGAVTNKVVSVLGRAVAELDVFLAGSTSATTAGRINAGNISLEGVAGKLTASETKLLGQLDSLPTTMHKERCARLLRILISSAMAIRL